jgi:hypothetical protein
LDMAILKTRCTTHKRLGLAQLAPNHPR